MKPAIALILSLILLSTCGACGVQPAPTATLAPAATLTAVETSTPLTPDTSTPSPTLSPSATRQPTETPAPPTIEAKGIDKSGNELTVSVKDPKISNSEFFDVTDPDSPFRKFTNAFVPRQDGESDDAFQARQQALAVEVAAGMRAEVETGTDGKQFIILRSGDLAVTPNFDETNTPLLIAEQGENGEWKWGSTNTRLPADGLGLNLGVYVEPSGSFKLSDPNIKINFNQLVVPIYWDNIFSKKNSENFSLPNDYVSSAGEDMDLLGMHAVYQNIGTIPDWMENESLSKEDFQSYINAVVSRYPNVKIWTISNESYSTDFFAKKFGYPEYIKTASEQVKASNPEAIRIYNDFDIETVGSTKYNRIKALVDKLKSEQLIDGIGIQLHIDPNDPPTKELLKKNFDSWKMPVHLTEIDVSTDDEALKAQIFKIVFEAALESGVCKDMNIWGFGPATWKPNANLFDNNSRPNQAYYNVMKVLFDQFFSK